MRRGFALVTLFAVMLTALSWAEETIAPTPPKEWEPPVAQVITGLQGQVTAVDAQARTFTVMQPSRHRQPPVMTVVGVNRDTQYIMNEAVLAKMLKVGDKVRVEAQRPAPLGVAIWAEGTVASLDPLVVEAAKDVKVTVLPGAEVVLVRIKAMKFEDLAKGMDVQVVGYRATDPFVAKSVETFTVAAGAAAFLDQGPGTAAPEKPAP